jgi:hypothetical protein
VWGFRMAIKGRVRLVEILLAVLLAVVNFGCGGNGSSSVTVPPPPISISPASVSVQPGSTQQFTATINTGSGGNVTWTLACSSVPCGTVSPTSTASGAPTTYTPPVTLPAANLSVTLTATSTADATKFASASATVPQLPGFAGVSEAHADTANGMARLIINGKPAPPLWFMYTQNFPAQIQFLAPQMQDAISHGIHIYFASLLAWPWDNQGTAPLDFSSSDQVLDTYMKNDPQALLIIDLGIWPGPGWIPPVPLTTADYTLYPDGQQTNDAYHISMASDTLFNGYMTSLPHVLQHYENSSYAAHILGYSLSGGNTGEWFPVEFWRGPDYSPVNTQHFQAWLQTKYGTDAALSGAWAMPGVTIATAQVPPPQAGRFPMTSVVNGNTPLEAFYQLPQEQDWVDYSAYISDLFSQRILDAAQLVKTQTGGKRIVEIQNGYLMDLYASFNGHLRLDKILASPEVDVIGASASCLYRLAGAAGGVDITVDSVIAHGKVWVTEDDYLTYLSANSIFPPIQLCNPPTADLTETVDVLDRELAGGLIHRAGTVWFDISENGTFNDPAIWTPMSDHGIPLFNQLYANPQPYKADVALIIDRNSILYQKNDYDMALEQRAYVRYALAKAGVASGFYTLDDFLDGTEPPSQIYIFANANYLTDDQIIQIQSRLNAEGATAIWQYASGFLGPSGPDPNRASSLTGIQLTQMDGYGYTSGVGSMAGYSWGLTNHNMLSPRLVVTDSNAEILGRYQSDNQVSCARKKVGNFESIFMGEFTFGPYQPAGVGTAPSADVLRALLQLTGVHLWSATEDVVFTDRNLLVIHAASAGPDTISLPAGVSATPLGGGTPSTGTLNINFARIGETQWFQLSPASGAPSNARAPRKSN